MIAPFTVPHFTEDGSTLLAFPTKADFLIADMDNDGKITDADQALWNDPFALDQRLMTLAEANHPEWTEGDEFPLIWDEDWWQAANIVIWAKIDNTDTVFTWTDNWELAMVLPKSMIDLQMSLLYIGTNQRTFHEQALSMEEQIEQRLEHLNIQTSDWFTPTYKRLAARVEHVNDTYVRL